MDEAKRRLTREQFQQLVEGVTRKLADNGLLIEAGWVGFEKLVLPEHASPAQRADMRKAFFGGAYHVFTAMMTMMDTGEEPTDADTARLERMHLELERFKKEVLVAAMHTKGTA